MGTVVQTICPAASVRREERLRLDGSARSARRARLGRRSARMPLAVRSLNLITSILPVSCVTQKIDSALVSSPTSSGIVTTRAR